MSTTILQLATQYSIYSGCIMFAFGIFGNSMNIIVFTQFKLFRNNRSAFYIIVESISNFFYHFVSLSLTILTIIYGDDATGRSPLWCKFRAMLTQPLVITALYMISFASIDQFFSTNYWFYSRDTCTMKLAKYITFAFISFSIVHSIIFGLFFDTAPSTGCGILNPICLQYSTYFFYPLLVGFIPVVIASFFSILAYRNVRHIIRRQIPIVRRRLDQQMTALVLVRVIVFVCFLLPYVLYRTYILNFPIPRSNPMEYAIGRLVQAIFVSYVGFNYMASFYVFLISSSRFRRQFKFVLMKKCWRPCKSRCLFKQNRVIPENVHSNGGNLDIEEDV